MKRHARSTSARVGGALHRKVRRGEAKRREKVRKGEAKRRKEVRSEEKKGREKRREPKPKRRGRHAKRIPEVRQRARGGRGGSGRAARGGSGSRGSGQRLSLGLDGRVIGALGLQFDRHVPREPSQVAFERRGGRGERWAKRWPGMPKMGCLGGLWHAWDA